MPSISLLFTAFLFSCCTCQWPKPTTHGIHAPVMDFDHLVKVTPHTWASFACTSECAHRYPKHCTPMGYNIKGPSQTCPCCPCHPGISKGPNLDRKVRNCLQDAGWLEIWLQREHNYDTYRCGYASDSFPPYLPSPLGGERRFKRMVGRRAKLMQFPWTVKIIISDHGKIPKIKGEGSGVLISSDWVLTAAHIAVKCKQGYACYVYGGHPDWKVAKAKGWYAYNVQSWYNPGYAPVVVGNFKTLEECIKDKYCADLGLIAISKPIPNTNPICLPDKDRKWTSINYSGYGKSLDDKFEGVTPVISPLLHWGQGDVAYDHSTPNYVHSATEDAYMCYGDSGGAWQEQDQRPGSDNARRWYLAAISIYDTGPHATCHKGRSPESIGVDVTKHLTWICQYANVC